MVKERSVQIKKMICYVLKHWRSIIVLAVISGMILTGIHYYQSYNNAVASANAAPPASLADVKNSFSANELREIEYVRTYQNIIDSADNYFTNSILMQIPYDKVVKVTLQYQVLTENENEISKGALIAAYDNYVTSGEMSEAVTEKLDDGTEPQYLTEILSIPTNEVAASQKGNAVIYNNSAVEEQIFTVSLVHYDREKAADIAEVIKEVLQEYAKTLSETVEAHQLIFQTENIGVQADYSLQTLQYDRVNGYDSVSGGYLNKLGNLSEQQVEVYNNWDHIDEETSDNADEVLPQETGVVAITVKPSGKVFALGTVAGAFLMICFWMLTFLCTKKVRGEADYDVCNVYKLGEIQEEHKRKRMFSSIDQCINKLTYDKERKYSDDQIVKMIYSNIYLQCKKNDIDKLCVSGTIGLSFTSETWYVELKRMLEEKNIELKEIENVACYADALLEASEIKNILFVEKENGSDFDSMAEEVEACKNNDINILGGIMLHA